jgi:hypothetical protein
MKLPSIAIPSVLVSLITCGFSVPARAQAAPDPTPAPAAAGAPPAAPAPQVASPAAPAATGDGNAGSIDNTVSLFGILGYWYSGTGIGLGARYQKTLVRKVAIAHNDHIHDDIGIEAGVDYLHYNFGILNYNWSYNEVTVLAGITWNFWFSDNFAVYPKTDIGYRFGSWSTNTGISNPSGYGGIAFQGAAGVIYRIQPVALRAEVGSGSLRIGAGFQF